MKEAEAAAMRDKQQVAQERKQLADEKRRLLEKQKECENMKANEANLVKQEAAKIMAAERNRLEAEYKNKKADIKILLYISLFYSVAVTLIVAIASQTLKNDFTAFLADLYGVIRSAGQIVRTGALWASKWAFTANMDITGYVLFAITGLVLLLALAFVLVGTVFYVLKPYFSDKLRDALTAIIALVTLIIMVFYADRLRSVGFNANVIWLAVSINIMYAWGRYLVTRN